MKFKDFAEIVGVCIALFTLIKGVIEFRLQGTQKRAEQFLKMRDRYANFSELCEWLEHKDDEDSKKHIQEMPFRSKFDFLCLYEEIALMMNSGLIQPQVAHYMFGFYAIRCAENDVFLQGLEYESEYWSLFRDFVKQMKQVEQKFKYDRRTFRL
jgi:hypothetical protein